MNRAQAGFFAIGVLVVAVAIVVVGGLVRHARSPGVSEQVQASAEPQANAPAVPAAKPADAAKKDSRASAANTVPTGEPANAASPQPEGASASTAEKPEAVGGDGASAPSPAADASVVPDAGTAASGEASVSTESGGKTPANPSAADEAPAADADVPTFDVLRVEPDGSTVIAGHAEPNARVDVMSGGKAIVTTKAGEVGDFAAVLDQPLAPGNYELTLKASGKKGVHVSGEVATVSVPKDKGGDVLALVSRPGEASRIMTAPEPTADAKAVRPAAAAPDGKQGRAEPSVVAGTPGKQDTEMAALPPSGAAAGAVAPEAAAGGAAKASAEAPGVRIDAVEVEGDALYVAGAAKPGATVRVYADNALVGEAKAGEEGRFVVNGTMPLAVGNHVIRADLVDPATGRVVVRAKVPFDRPEGDRLAAVSPREEMSRSGAPGSPAGPNGATSPDIGKLGAEARSAVSELKQSIEAEPPQPAAVEAARTKAERSLKALAGAGAAEETASPPAASGSAEAPAVAGAADAARDALAALQSLPDIEPTKPLSEAQLDAVREKMAKVSKEVQSLPATPAPAVASATGEKGAPRTVQQPPLLPTDGFVIIRRGDTLWQIARRQYGQGVRYTTIYLANSAEISDPNLILPGQVFDVPQKSDKPLAQVEELHHELMRKERTD